MKLAKKIFALALALVMVMALGVSAFADDAKPGKIVIENSATDVTYYVFKLFDATVEDGAIAYFLDGDIPEAVDGFFVQSETGYITLNDTYKTSDGSMHPAVKNALDAWAASVRPAPAGIKGNGTTLTIDNLDYGYYVVRALKIEGGTVTVAISVDSTNPTAEIIDKIETKPTPPDPTRKVKTIVTGENTSYDKGTATYGETVNFEISINTVNYVVENGESTAITKYVVTDNPTGMEIDQSSVAVKVGDTDVTSAATIAFDAEGNMTVTIPWLVVENGVVTSEPYTSPNTITVAYSAVITSVDGASNSAAATYNENEPIGSNTVEVENFDITINKIDAATEEALADAEFELYADAEGTQKIDLVLDTKEVDGETVSVYRAATEEESAAEGFESAAIVTDSEGKAVIVGLKDGTYYLKETKAPSGYNRLAELQVAELNGGDLTVTVENQAGVELPSTGGIGTTIFYVVGGVLVAAAVVLLITKKRMSAKG